MRLLAVLLAPVVLLSACGHSRSGDANKATGRTAVGAPPAWAAPTDPLDRTRAARLEPEVRETLTHHVHAHLDVFFNGTAVVVPAGIGINITDPGVKTYSGPQGLGYGRIDGCGQPCISPLHTHNPDGILHTESADPEPNTLGQFFTEWGVRLDSSCVGDYCRPTTDVAIYVNGKTFQGDPSGIKLTDHTEIAIVIGRPPAKVPSKGDFSQRVTEEVLSNTARRGGEVGPIGRPAGRHLAWPLGSYELMPKPRSSSGSRSARQYAIAVAALLTLTVLSACGGGGSKTAKNTQASSRSGSDASTTSSTLPQPINRKIGKTGWYGGFAITVDTATLTARYVSDGTSANLDLGMTYVNLGTSSAKPPEVKVVFDGREAAANASDDKIPGGGKTTGTVSASLLSPSPTPTSAENATPRSLDDMADHVVLTYGDPSDNQTTIPLATATPVNSVQPRTGDVKATLKQGPVTATLLHEELAPSYAPGEKDQYTLSIRFSVSCGDCGYGVNLGRSDFSVLDSAGNSVTAGDRSPYCCDNLQSNKSFDDADHILTFVIRGLGSTFQVTLNNSGLVRQGSPAGTTSITLP